MKDAVATMGAILPDDAGGRDAVHVAVIACTAGERLFPGQDIGLIINNTEAEPGAFATDPTLKKIGIADPFIRTPIHEGQRFWLYLYPRTITGLSHRWTHPDLPDGAVAGTGYAPPASKLAAEQWLQSFARQVGTDYATIINTAVAATDGYINFGTGVSGDIPGEFWDHIETVSGNKIPGSQRSDYYSCAC